jgi:hypothetical protein
MIVLSMCISCELDGNVSMGHMKVFLADCAAIYGCNVRIWFPIWDYGYIWMFH